MANNRRKKAAKHSTGRRLYLLISEVIMTYIDDYYKGLTNTNVGYEATTPSVSRDGRSASFTMYIEDTTIEVDADLGYDGNRDEVTIELVYADAYDEDCAACDISEIDLEAVFVELSNKYGTIDKAYNLQAKAYHAEMSEH